MADTIERTIYKLELDDSGYSAGVDRLSNSTKKLSAEQERANKALAENEAALKKQAELVEKNRKALEDFTGSDTKARRQLEANLKSAQDGHIKLSELVANVRKGYEAANKAANDFVNTSQRATQLQQQTTGGKIPTGAPLGIVHPIISQVLNQPADDFDLKEAIAFGKTAQEFGNLRTAINAAGKEVTGFDQIVIKGKEALGLYDKIVDQTGDSTGSLRSQLRLGREELVRLEQAGKSSTKQYTDLELRVAKLTDAFGDQQARIKILASDTRALDFGKASIQSATSAFQIYSAVSILAGGANEKLQKQTLQLFAAMQLLTALEQLSITVKRGGVIATNAQAASQAVYTAVVGASTGALKAFRVALLATGIGAAIAGIALLISKIAQQKKELSEAAEAQKTYNDVLKQAGSAYAKAVTEVSELRTNIQLAKDGLVSKEAVLKQYNETIGKTTGQVKNLDEAEKALTKNADAYIRFTLLKAAANIALQGAAEKAFESTRIQLEQATTDFGDDPQGSKGAQAAAKVRVRRDKLEKEGNDFLSIQKGFLEEAKAIAKQFGFSFLPPPDTKATTVIQNEFARKKAELDERLAALTRKEAEDESKIRVEFAARLAKEQLEIERLLKEKKLTKGQAGILSAEAIQINKLELDKALADFRKKVTDARNKLNDEIQNLQAKATEDSLNLLQDEFNRRAQLIDFNEKRELADAKEATEERLAALELDRLLIGEQAYQDAKADIISAGELTALNIIRRSAKARQDLAADTFRASLDSLNALFEDQILNLDEITAGKILAEKALFDKGVINYDEFQKRITKILRDEKAERDRLRLLELNAELSAINLRLDAVTDAEEKAELLKRQRSVRASIADINSQTTDIVDPNKERVDTVADYAASIGQLADSVISFWQKANEAERAALDESISLQEQRVSAAQRIAERGNASYLKAEEDRLKELQVLRENAARRDLAINAALQASQLLVGITGAIAKIATPGIGIAETIGAIAVIFSALATGYGLVKSLQGNQPRLKSGTKLLKRDGHPSGTDTIQAWLNEGEAVIPTEKNKAYHPTVAAIYDGTIPAEHLNQFVKTYHSVKRVPQPNYDRIKDAAELSIGENGKMAVLLSEQNKKLDENNDLLRQTNRALKAMGVNVSMDRNGIAVSVMEVVEQINIDKRS